MKLKFLLPITAICVLVMYSSGTAQNFKEIKIPCQKEGNSNAMYFRATQSGASRNMATARDKALLNAKARLASLIESTVASVTEQYTNEVDLGDSSEFQQSFEQMTKEVTKQTLVEVNITCETQTKNSRGEYETFIAIEVSKDAIYNGVNKEVAKDQKLQLKYNQMKFKEKFDEEMEKLERSDR